MKSGLSPHDITILCLSLGILLGTARVFGEILKRFGQPAVLGEILAGIVLGPTILGAVFPEAFASLFPLAEKSGTVLNGLSTLSISLFLLVAGLEVDLSTVWRHGRTAICVGVLGMVVPFAFGFVPAFLTPSLVGYQDGTDPMVFALFFATALSISALPVIAKTLMDLNLYRTDLGMLTVAAAVFNDIVGWLVFAVILGMIGTSSGMVEHSLPLGSTIALTLGFAAFCLTVGRWAVHRVLPWIQAHASWPGGVLGFAIVLAMFGAAFTEWIGVHAIFGAFLVGVMLGDSSHLRQKTRTIIEQFVSAVFAPLFFAGIGLSVDFGANFDPLLVVIVLVIACAGKIVGCGLGARLGKLDRREGWALAFGMNARGAMEIILGLLALQYGLIGERLFVALVVMAIVTSMMSGPIMQAILKRPKPRHFVDFISGRTFVPALKAADREEAIKVLADAAAPATTIKAETIVNAAWTREKIMPTGIGNAIAVPHARLEGLTQPVIALGISKHGVDFDAPDGEAARLIFLILTPSKDDGAQLEILADIARSLKNPETRASALAAKNATELLAVMKSARDDH